MTDEFDPINVNVKMEKDEGSPAAADGVDSIDWMNIGKVDTKDLPELPTDENFAREKAYWERVKDIGYDDLENKDTYKLDEVPEDLQVHKRLREEPMPPVEELKTPEEKVHYQRYKDVFDLHVKYGAQDDIIRQFFLFRKSGFYNPAEHYHHVYSICAVWLNFEACSLLRDEMRSLGFGRSYTEIVSDIGMMMVVRAEDKVNELWEELLASKFEIHHLIFAHRLAFYVRFTSDFDKIMSWYEFMKSEGKVVDPSPGNLLIHMALVNKEYTLALAIYDEMVATGLLYIDPKKDQVLVDYEDQKISLYPKRKSIEATYVLMAEVYIEQDDLAKCWEFINNAKAAWAHLRDMKEQALEEFQVHPRLYEKIVDYHMRKREPAIAKKMIIDNTRNGNRPNQSLWRKFMKHLMTYDTPYLYLEFAAEFELWGFDYDDSLYEHLVMFWYNVNDDRRALNTYRDIKAAGMVPSAKAMEAMLLVYERSGRPDDVQMFYHQQLKAGNPMTYEFHATMIRDYLKRGYPGSARDVLIRMAQNNTPAKADVVSQVAIAYGDLGGGEQVATMIEEEMDGPTPLYVLGPEVLSAAIYGLAAKSNQSATDATRAEQLWDKYGLRVQLNPESAERIIRGFAGLNSIDHAWEAFHKLQQEWTFSAGAKDYQGVFTALAEAPLGHRPFSDLLGLFEYLTEHDLVPNVEMFVGAVQQCSARGSVKQALVLMKRFIREFDGLPFHAGLVIEFFNVIARFDLGLYKREAHVWLNRLIPTQKPHIDPASSILPLAGNQGDLADIKSSLLSSLQSIEVARYIMAMDESLVNDVQPTKAKNLFEGSLVDVGDLLMAEGYNLDEVQTALNSDTNSLKQFVDAIEHAQKKGKSFSPGDILSGLNVSRGLRA